MSWIATGSGPGQAGTTPAPMIVTGWSKGRIASPFRRLAA